MKLSAVFGVTALAVLLGISAPVYAQDESHPQEDRRAEPDGRAHEQDRQNDKRADQPRENREADHQADQPRENRQADQDREKENSRGEQQGQTARHDDRRDGQGEGREARQGGHIPDDRFRANFGREHTFRVGQPVIVEGSPRFQFGGYWFVIAQPWPVGWAYSDPVYVDYLDDQYFLLSPVHPGVQIAINVIF
ncbi:MAG TPA: hypothetical protein VNZ03_13855 [Terriglobales bacterium]|jgi:hypothetical protein|nr:hypothetical protein [Terriglobales bacterium]